jgi:hypothetical protein
MMRVWRVVFPADCDADSVAAGMTSSAREFVIPPRRARLEAFRRTAATQPYRTLIERVNSDARTFGAGIVRPDAATAAVIRRLPSSMPRATAAWRPNETQTEVTSQARVRAPTWMTG